MAPHPFLLGCIIVVLSVIGGSGAPHDVSLIVHPGMLLTTCFKCLILCTGKTAGNSQLNFRQGDDEKFGVSFVHTMSDFEDLKVQNATSVIVKIEGKDLPDSFIETSSVLCFYFFAIISHIDLVVFV